MYVIASLCILFSSANIFLISSVIFVISNSPFHFYYVVAFYTFSRDFRCLGRDSRHHAPPRRTPLRHRTPPHHPPPRRIPSQRTPTARPTTARPTTAHPTTASHTATVTHHAAVSLLISLLLLYFIREIIDFNEHQPRIKRG